MNELRMYLVTVVLRFVILPLIPKRSPAGHRALEYISAWMRHEVLIAAHNLEGDG